MKQSTLVTQLDAFFAVNDFDERAFWNSLTSDYQLMLNRYLVPGFLPRGGNGLMLDNTENIERVYLAVYPSRAVIDMAIAREIERDAPGALLFVHRAAAYDPAYGRVGFNMSEAHLADLCDQNISLYMCHAPLDCHPELSTVGALADALRLRDQERFVCTADGRVGAWGHVNPMPFQAFAERTAKACALPTLRYDQVGHAGKPVACVAVVPGGGADIELMSDAYNLGCDTYVSGRWWPYADSEWAAKQRARLQEFIACMQMNLLGVGAYHSELVVMRGPLRDWFKHKGIDTQLLREPEETNEENQPTR